MNKTNKVSISAALIVLLCFFLPWIQVSCGASRDSIAGIDLVREGNNSIWLIPVLMLVVIGAGLLRGWSGKIDFGALLTFVAGIISAYLMNRERIRAEDTSALLDVRVTGWFWLGLASSIVVAVSGAIQFLRKPKPSL
jgi:ABC-type branched-subunit amino acid transport system permease subunit